MISGILNPRGPGGIYKKKSKKTCILFQENTQRVHEKKKLVKKKSTRPRKRPRKKKLVQETLTPPRKRPRKKELVQENTNSYTKKRTRFRKYALDQERFN